MKLLVLGSGGRALCQLCTAGGAASVAPRSRQPGAVAVRDDRGHWLLLVAAPEITRHPLIEAAAREGRLAGVVLLDARLEHAASLAALSRTRPLRLHATPAVFEELTARLPLLGVPPLGGDLRWQLLPIAGDVRTAPLRLEGMESLEGIAIDDGGWAAPYSPNRRDPVVGDGIALRIADRHSGQSFVYSPGLGIDAEPWMHGADCLLVGGGACRMTSDEAAATARYASIGARRTVLVHLPDCDPRLQAGSVAQRAAEHSGLEIAHDGMEIEL